MKKIITIIDNGQKLTHFDYGKADYTLCGLDTLGDPNAGLVIPDKQNKVVNCGACISIVEYCKGILKSQYRKP